MGRKAADARLQRLAAVESPGERRVFAPRQIAELVSVPRDSDRVGIVRILGLARELQPIAYAQLRPDIGGRIVTKTRQRGALHQQPDGGEAPLRPQRCCYK